MKQALRPTRIDTHKEIPSVEASHPWLWVAYIAAIFAGLFGSHIGAYFA